MHSTEAEQFFYNNAGYSWAPGQETREDGKRRTARQLAKAERWAQLNGYEFSWEIDPDTDSSEFDSSEDPWPLYQCTMRRRGELYAVAGLGAVDFGPDGSPDSDPYRRVVEAELALEVMPNKPR